MAEVSNPRPTSDPTLDTALAALVKAVSGQLGGNFVGAYLHGALAVGGFDALSDADVAIVVGEDIAEADLPALQALHARLLDELPASWGQRLQLSYFPAALLKRWNDTPRDPPDVAPRAADWVDPATGAKARAYPLLHLAAGKGELARSERDNNRVTRWVLRERGVVLAGPDPKELIDPVTPIALRAEVRGQMQALAARCLADPATMKQRRLQAHLVTLFCRMLHTLTTGEVGSKQEATAWAVEAFALRWNALIRRALALRADPAETLTAPTPREDVQETQAFIRQVLRQDAPKKPKPKRRSPKPGFTFNALAPSQPRAEAPPAKRAPSKRPFSKGPPSRGGPSAGGYAKAPTGKRPPPRDGAARYSGPKSEGSGDAPARDASFRGPRGPAPSKPSYSKGPPKRDGAPRDGAARGPSRGPSSFSKGPPRGGPSKGPGGRTFSKGPPGKRPPPKR